MLILCAGISRDRDEYELDTFQRVLDVNLVSGMRLCELARPLLRERGGKRRADQLDVLGVRRR